MVPAEFVNALKNLNMENKTFTLPEPVFLPRSRQVWTPGYICGASPVTVCYGKELTGETITYKTLTYRRGCPEPMEFCEAVVREFFGKEACKTLYTQSKNHTSQRTTLELALGTDLCNVRWGTWEWTFGPVMILGETPGEYRVMFNPTSGLSGNVLTVPSGDVTEITAYEAWRFLWCGRDINTRIQKECLPEEIREDIVRGMQ